MLKVDSHQHFWIFDPVRDSWIIEDMAVIRKDFLPEDLKPILDRNAISACIAVQADQSEAETVFLLDLAEANSFVKGVVGWVDLRSADLAKRLEYYQAFPKLKGFRHIVQAEEPGFMLQPAFLNGVAALKTFGFAYDILVRSTQICEATKLVELNPGQHFVLDHIGKPPIKNKEIKVWLADIKDLAAHQNVCCKLSGMVTEADLNHWKPADLHPYMDIIMNEFGANRVMFGSDWPVCKLAAEYDEVCDITHSYLEKLTLNEQELIWAGNAIEFYKLDIN
jgi:L-fuconolactonase